MTSTGNLAVELGAQPAFRKTDNFKIIQDEINRLVMEKRQTPVIIDEANYIGNAVLNDLKMLFNFEMDSRDRLSSFFVVFHNLTVPCASAFMNLSAREL